MTCYYNENDPKIAAWLRELIKQGLIAYGEVDDRSIEDVKPSDLAGFVQCHFFAGIGGWSYALRLAGWPDNGPVWTGSCPCQPFSTAGKGKGTADERHLWPSWFHFIRVCKPPVIFGEQVEAAINHGWLDLVQNDLEGEGYAFGAACLPAASVGAPHIRQRLWWVADDTSRRLERSTRAGIQNEVTRFTGCGNNGELANPNSTRLQGWESMRQRVGEFVVGADSVAYELVQSDSDGCEEGSKATATTRYWNSIAPTSWVGCRDSKHRPVKPGIQLLAHGVPARMVRLRGYGNAIVPQVAAEFIKSYMDIR